MITVSCNGCEFQYRVSDDKTGKRFKCRQCGETCTVPGPRRRRSKSGSSPEPRKRQKQKKQAAQDEWEDDAGAAEDDYQSYDDYESYDYDSNDDYESYEEESYEDDAYEDYQPARSRRRKTSGSSKPKKHKKKTSRSSDSGGLPFTNPLVWLGFPIAATLVTMAVTLILPPLGMILSLVLILAGLILALIGGIRSLVDAFREDVVCGFLYLIVPFYPLYYLVTRWEEQKGPFLMNVCGTLLIIGTTFALPLVQQARDGI